MRDRLLVHHFLARFLDHDLISPHMDRREVLTITCALLVVSSLFLAVFLAVKYQFDLFMPPGMASIFSLDDRFFLMSLGMLAMALLAVGEWDALALDPRDTAVLGPLPIPRSAIVRAKFAAIALFAAAFDFGLSIGPTVLRAGALPVRLPIGLTGAARLTLAHFVCAVAAGAFGFIAVLGVRETLRAVGGRVFQRISAALQASLVVLLVTALLLLPRSYSAVAVKWLSHGPVRPTAVPPLWFVGLHETMAGSVIDALPRGEPPRRYAAAEAAATTLYRSLWPLLHRLGVIALLASAALVAVTAAACAWNNRKLPVHAPAQPGPHRWLKRALVWLATHAIVRDPEPRAGFFFTLQTLARSLPHRVTIAASAAVSVALMVVTLGGGALRRTADASSIPTPYLVLQTLLLVVLLTGFRHVVRVPAHARANWIFRLAWSGDERRYLAGVKRAALFVLVAPTLAASWVLGHFVVGPRVATLHAVTGVGIALLLLEVMFLGYQNLPFASSYTRSEDLKSVAPIYVLGTLIGAIGLAAIERAALAGVAREAAFFACLAALVAAARAVDAQKRMTRVPVDWDELAADAHERLSLVRD